MQAAVQAQKLLIIVVAVDAQAEGPIDAFVGSRNYDAGYIAGEFMAEVGGKESCHSCGIPVVPILEVKGLEMRCQLSNIQIVDIQNGHQERSYAMTVENMLQSNPDLDAIFSVILGL